MARFNPDLPAFPLKNDPYSHDGMSTREYAVIHIAAGLKASLAPSHPMSHERFAEIVWARVDALFKHQPKEE